MNKPPHSSGKQAAQSMQAQSVLEIPDDKKADILLELGLLVRRNIHEWETRAYTASTWSIGIMLGVLTVWATRSTSSRQEVRLALVIAVLLFGVGTQFLLAFCRVQFMGNERTGKAASRGLRMYEPGQYLSGEPFLSPESSWKQPWHIIAVEVLHGLVTIATALGISFA